MAEQESFVDLEKKGTKNLREVRLTPEDLVIIKENPGGLTKEGCLVRIGQWAQSNNQLVLFRYLAMYKFCNIFKESGDTTTGRIYLARRNHINKAGFKENKDWTEEKVKVNLDEIKQLADIRIKDLVFITKKGG